PPSPTAPPRCASTSPTAPPAKPRSSPHSRMARRPSTPWSRASTATRRRLCTPWRRGTSARTWSCSRTGAESRLRTASGHSSVKTASGLTVVRVGADSAPADRGLAVDLDELEGGAAVGPGERPRHLPDAGAARHRPHPQRRRPRRKSGARVTRPRFVDGADRGEKQSLVAVGELGELAPKLLGALELHWPRAAASRSAMKLSASSKVS